MKNISVKSKRDSNPKKLNPLPKAETPKMEENDEPFDEPIDDSDDLFDDSLDELIDESVDESVDESIDESGPMREEDSGYIIPIRGNHRKQNRDEFLFDDEEE